MARPNYGWDKRQREQRKKRKKEEKRQRRADRSENAGRGDGGEGPGAASDPPSDDAGEAPAESGQEEKRDEPEGG